LLDYTFKQRELTREHQRVEKGKLVKVFLAEQSESLITVEAKNLFIKIISITDFKELLGKK
jgi:hypothetical protein